MDQNFTETDSMAKTFSIYDDPTANNSFLGNVDLDAAAAEDESAVILASAGDDDPIELIVSRVIFALLVSTSLVINLLLLLAVFRRRETVHVVYAIATAFLLPDLVFYTKLIVELMDWDREDHIPRWATSQWTCGLWQFGTHW